MNEVIKGHRRTTVISKESIKADRKLKEKILHAVRIYCMTGKYPRSYWSLEVEQMKIVDFIIDNREVINIITAKGN